MAEARRADGWTLSAILLAAVAVLSLLAALFVARDASQLWSTPRLLTYVMLPAAIGFGAAYVCWFRRSASLLFLVYLASFVGALALADLYLGRERAAIERAAWTAHPPAREPQNDLVPQFCPGLVDLAHPPFRIGGSPVLPLGGISNGKLSLDPPHSTDVHGFNNPAGLWDKTPVDILAVGDSFTYGADVPYGQGFVDVIRRNVPLTVNLGCGGNGPFSELAALVEYGPLLKPRLVLWVYYEGNDLTKDVYAEAGSKLLTSYLDPTYTQGLAVRQRDIDDALRAYLAGQRTHNAAAPGGQSPVPAFGPTWRETATLATLRDRLGLRHAIRPEALGHLDRVLARAKQVVAGWGGRLVFISLPAETRYAGLLGHADAEGYASRVRSIVQAHGIPLIDVGARIDRESDPRRLYRGHFNAEGYALAARTILDDIGRLGLLTAR